MWLSILFRIYMSVFSIFSGMLFSPLGMIILVGKQTECLHLFSIFTS